MARTTTTQQPDGTTALTVHADFHFTITPHGAHGVKLESANGYPTSTHAHYHEAVVAAVAMVEAGPAPRPTQPLSYTSCGWGVCQQPATGYADWAPNGYVIERRSACDEHGSDGALAVAS
jgi:hypothetical protein